MKSTSKLTRHASLCGLVIILTMAIIPVQQLHAAGTSEKSPSTGPRSISVGGSGAVSLPPDAAAVRLSVETEHQTAQTAVQQNASRMKAIMMALSTLGIQESAIVTTDYNVYIQYPPHDQRQKVPETYRVNNSIEVRLEDIALTGAVIDSAFSAGATSVRQVRFFLSDPADARTKAMQLAMQDARQKAETLAGELGVSLGQPLRIQENYQSPEQPVMLERMAFAAAETPIAAGDYTVSAQVMVVWELQTR